MRFIRTALKAWGGRKRGWGWVHSSAVPLWPSQQQLKQVCLYSGHRGQDKPHMVQAGHTWPHSDLTPAWEDQDFIKKWRRGSLIYYLCNLIQTLPVHKWAWLKDIYEQSAYQCQNFQQPCFEFRTPRWAVSRGLSTLMRLQHLILGHLSCPRSLFLNSQSHPTELRFTQYYI